MPLVDSCRSGAHYAALCELRDLLAERMTAASVRDSAALARQLVDVLKAIDDYPQTTEVDPVDALAARRQARIEQSAQVLDRP